MALACDYMSGDGCRLKLQESVGITQRHSVVDGVTINNQLYAQEPNDPLGSVPQKLLQADVCVYIVGEYYKS